MSLPRALACFFVIVSPALAAPDIEDLLSKMTLEEKLGQIQQLHGDFATGGTGEARATNRESLIREGRLGSILNLSDPARIRKYQRIAVEESRLKIPLLIAYDVIHGWRTIFPIPLGEAAAWDPALCEETAATAAAEAGAQGIRWTFAPMVDIARDPRWGRIAEGAGEDPFLGSAIAAARVRGFQRGGDFAACAKHWAAYGAAEAGRDYNTADLSERTLREVHFPPFKAALDAGVHTFMSAFNEINGVPATANRFLLTDVLRDEWGFRGLVVSDYDGVVELLHHGSAADDADAITQALLAGTDMEMASTALAVHGTELVKSGRMPMAVIDEAVRRILTVKKRIGLFENPYATSQPFDTAAARSLARRSAASSIVLLRNRDRTLPIAKDVASIALVGPLGDDSRAPLGPWRAEGDAADVVTLLAGLKQKFPNAKITHVAGCDVQGREPVAADSLRAAVAEADFVVVAVGETANMSGEARSRSDIGLPGNQEELVRVVHECGKPYAVTLFNGRPLTLGWVAENSPAILVTWLAGTESGHAIADVLSGDVNPGGKLPVTFPRTVGQIPLYYAHKNTGRPAYLRPRYVSNYLDVSNDPQFPFGFGLSYTTFKISEPKISRTISPAVIGRPVFADIEARAVLGGAKIFVEATVENTGDRAGDEVVQLYIRDKVSSVTRPVRELKGFRRVSLEPGGRTTVEFELGARELGFYDRDMKWVVEPGEFDIFVGNSSLAASRVRFTLD